MGKYDGLAEWLAAVAPDTREVVLSFAEVDRLVGGLPDSARRLRTWWGNSSHSQSLAWRRAGWHVGRVDLAGRQVAFRRGTVGGTHHDRGRVPAARRVAPPPAAHSETDVVLVGCVKSKAATARPAKDLYVSALWQGRRRAAEASGCPWFILSAEHGLVAPDDVLAPYERYLAAEPVAYRTEWARAVVGRLAALAGPLAGRTVEIHAGATYVAALRPLLDAAGAVVVTPMAGLTMGEQLARYAEQAHAPEAAPASDLVSLLADPASARPCGGFPWGRSDLHAAGLYSWWVDPEGAADLTRGLGHVVGAGLVYAGQTGATSRRAGVVRVATLRQRIGSQHLRGRLTASTFRLTLAAALTDVLDLRLDAPGRLTAASTARLNAWMAGHLSVTCVPVADRDTVAGIEERLLAALDPPLNLHGVGATPLRRALSERRRALSSG